MKCQSCGKKEASIKYYENINGVQKNIYLCVDCAQNLGIAEFSHVFSPIFTTIPKYMESIDTQSTCLKCGYPFEEYTKTGLFGCPDCYTSFKDRLDKLFLKLHGKNRHVKLDLNNSSTNKKIKSSKPKTKNISKQEELEKLREDLKKLVENEEYEKAAVIRDKIKKIEGQV